MLQRRLTQVLGRVGASRLGANLVIYQGVADVLGQAGKLIRVRDAVQEPRSLASLFQWDEVSENIIQFPNKLRMSDRPTASEHVGLPLEDLPPFFFLNLARGNVRAQRLCQPFNSRDQRFYRFATCRRLLGER